VDGERCLDYAALDERCARAAGWLRARGVACGDRVALLLENQSAYLEAVLGAARLGAIAVPLNTRLAPPELRYVLEDSAPAALLHEKTLAAGVRATGLALPRATLALDADAWEQALDATDPHLECAPCRSEDAVLLLYTSGTTGVPKGALLPQRKSLYNCLNAQLFFDLTRHDRVLVVLPLFHSFGLQILALPVLYTGGTVVLQRRFQAESVLEAIEREGISFLGGVPTMYRDLLAELERAPARFRRESLRFLFTAGAAIGVETIHAFERHGLVLKQGFGQTETSILCCLDAEDAVGAAGLPRGRARGPRAEPRGTSGGLGRGRQRRDGRDRGARPHQHARLLEPAGRDGTGPAGRLAPHGRPRDARRGGLRVPRGTGSRHVHLGRREPPSIRTSRRSPSWACPTSAGARSDAPTWSCAKGPCSTPRASRPGDASVSPSSSCRAAGWPGRSFRARRAGRSRSTCSTVEPYREAYGGRLRALPQPDQFAMRRRRRLPTRSA
jgi:acyl-CoA synthetase (AMP-forming)/AMP-acid ligase II